LHFVRGLCEVCLALGEVDSVAKKITARQERFVQALFSGLSQRQAYMEAYNCRTCKGATIDNRASKLFKKEQVSARLTELQNELKNRNIVTKERILEEFAKIGFADIKDFLSYRTEKTQVDEPVRDEDGTISIYKYKMIIEAKDSKDVDGTIISEVSLGKDGTFKFKLHDKLNALEKMGKILGIFTEKIEHTGKLEMPTIIISE
jgi:phage terminase small subunit